MIRKRRYLYKILKFVKIQGWIAIMLQIHRIVYVIAYYLLCLNYKMRTNQFKILRLLLLKFLLYQIFIFYWFVQLRLLEVQSMFDNKFTINKQIKFEQLNYLDCYCDVFNNKFKQYQEIIITTLRNKYFNQPLSTENLKSNDKFYEGTIQNPKMFEYQRLQVNSQFNQSSREGNAQQIILNFTQVTQYQILIINFGKRIETRDSSLLNNQTRIFKMNFYLHGSLFGWSVKFNIISDSSSFSGFI